MWGALSTGAATVVLETADDDGGSCVSQWWPSLRLRPRECECGSVREVSVCRPQLRSGFMGPVLESFLLSLRVSLQFCFLRPRRHREIGGVWGLMVGGGGRERRGVGGVHKGTETRLRPRDRETN